MSKTRVLVVDDSAFMRRIIREMIESDPELEVIGTARDGREGVDMTMSLNPDVVTMDIEMPRMNGLEATELIMDKLPTPIIIVSSLTHEGAKATFDALDRGAAEYIAKNLATSSLDIMKIQSELVSKIKAVARKKSRVAVRVFKKVELPLPAKKGFVTQKMAIVAIGASTGGPRAVQEVLSSLPGLDIPFIVSVHMPKAFTGAFADRLNTLSALHVKEAENGEKVEPGNVLVSPGGVQTRVKRRGVADFYIHLDNEPPDSIYKPSVDVMMTSAAETYAGRVLGVILTGMGHDGCEGMRLIKSKGGKTIAQNEETSTVYGMPKAVVDAGVADKVLPLEKIAGEIVNMI